MSGFLFLSGLSPRAINSVAMGGWSIAVESTFYLLLPKIHRTFKTVRSSLWLFVISASVCLGVSQFFAMSATDSLHNQYFAFLYFPVEFPIFVLGLISYLVWRDYGRTWLAEQSKSDRMTFSALLMIVAMLILGGSFPLVDAQLYCSSLTFVPLLLALAFYPWPVLVNRTTVYLGRISYSVYLLHFVVLYMLVRFTDSSATWKHFAEKHIYDQVGGFFCVWLGVLLVTGAVASITYRVVEKPGMALGRYFVRVSG